MLSSKDASKMQRLISASVRPATSVQVFQEETPNKILTELPPPPKLSNLGPSRVTRSLHGDVLTSSLVIQKMKQKAKYMRNNFKKMFILILTNLMH